MTLAAIPPLAAFDESKVTPGVLGFLVVAALALALFFLLRSMTRHLGKVRFDEDAPQAGDEKPRTPPAP